MGTSFDSARESFKSGDYAKALELTDQAISQLPNDAALHEFRGVVLFALHRYEDAAAPLYAVLAVGPGWDWKTLVGLYSDVSVYTDQLRVLERYCSVNPRSASARFVLAYLYLTQGNTDAAVQQLKRVVALQPKDTISARLIERLAPAGSGPANQPPAAAPACARTRADWLDRTEQPRSRRAGWKEAGPLGPIRRPRSRSRFSIRASSAGTSPIKVRTG